MPSRSPSRPAHELGIFGHFLWLCLAFLMLPSLVAPAQAAKRVAFVVGNAKYENEKPLTNPYKDDALSADVLARDLKFD